MRIASSAVPLLIYDGDCAFCFWWARYWQRLSEGGLRIAPYQQAAADYPDIPVTEFRRAAQYVAADGQVASAAEASLRALGQARGRGCGLWAYRHLPGFAWLSETIYGFIATHRGAFYRVTLALWGKEPEPPGFALASAVFLRIVGLIYFAAFSSFAVQALGLIGSDGILPAADYLGRIHERFGALAYLRYPTLFWIDASDFAIRAAPWAGAAVSLLLVFNVLPRLSLIALFALYLSLFNAGQVFMIYQWDLLLLEAGVLAILLTTGSVLAIWLMRWLLFRFMFLSGVVKLASGDASWTELSVLTRYFETEPLPTRLAWYAHQLPDPALAGAAVAMFAVELVLPFFIFLPRRPRFAAASAFIVFQFAIIATGNYNFFNLLTIALCLLLFDDQAIRQWVPEKWRNPTRSRPPKPMATSLVAIYAVVVLLAGSGQIYTAITGSEAPAMFASLSELAAPLHAINTYGAFAEIITDRQEIVVEGSLDNQTWREYAFKYKPGDLFNAPGFNIPHQPRLDWQMWFAAIGNESREWFPNFLQRLLAGSPDVLALLANDPFAGAKPKAVRAMLYEYRYTTPRAHAVGQWWQRRLIGIYYPALSMETVAPQPPPQQPQPLFDTLVRPRE